MPFPGDGVPDDGLPSRGKTDPAAKPSAPIENDERGMACEARGYDSSTGGIIYRRVAPMGMHFHLEEGRERWLSQMATTREDPSGLADASTSRLYHEFPTRDNDPFPYGQFGQVFLIPCTAPYYGKDEDGHPLHRMVIGIDKGWHHHTDRVQGPLAHIGEKKWPTALGREIRVDCLWRAEDKRWHWKGYGAEFGPNPNPNPNPGAPSTPTPGKGKKPQPTGGGAPSTPSTQPTGGGAGATTTSGGTTDPWGKVGDDPWYGGSPGYPDPPLPDVDSPPFPGAGGPGPPSPFTSGGGGGGAGGNAPTGKKPGFYDPGWGGSGGDWPGGFGESNETFEAMMVTEDHDREEPNPMGVMGPQIASDEEPNEGDGIATVRAVWSDRKWPGDGFWVSGFRAFTPMPNRNWPGDGYMEDPGELSEQIITPDFAQETIEALTRFTQGEYDQQRTETAWKDIAERINAISDYLANVDQRVRSEMPERHTVTVLAGQRTVITTTTYDYAGAAPEVQATVVGPYGVDIVAYADSGSKRQATLQLTGTAAADTEISVDWTYTVARSTEVAVGSGV